MNVRALEPVRTVSGAVVDEEVAAAEVLVVAEDQALVSWAVMTQMRSYPLVLVGPSRRVLPRSRGKNVSVEVLGELRVRLQRFRQWVHQGEDSRHLLQSSVVGHALFRVIRPIPEGKSTRTLSMSM